MISSNDDHSMDFLKINGDTHINALVEYINSLHKRITGVEAKSHTQTFMHDELKRIHDAYSISAYPSTPLEIDIYEVIIFMIIVIKYDLYLIS